MLKVTELSALCLPIDSNWKALICSRPTLDFGLESLSFTQLDSPVKIEIFSKAVWSLRLARRIVFLPAFINVFCLECYHQRLLVSSKS